MNVLQALGLAAPADADVLRSAADSPGAATLRIATGAYDSGGETLDEHGNTLFDRPLVQALGTALAVIGYGVQAQPPKTFGPSLAHALREFQRDAAQGSRWLNDALVTVTPTFSQAPSGELDAATLTELLAWRDAGYRAPIRFMLTSRHGASIADVGFRDITLVGHRAYAVEPGADALVFRQVGRMVKESGSQFGIESAQPPNWLPDMAQPLAGETWQKRAICEVSFNESLLQVETANGWDGAFMSVGIYHWTIGTGDGEGELPQVMTLLAPADFTRLLTPCGVSTAPAPSQTVAPNASEKIARRSFTLDGVELVAALKEEFRGLRWIERFQRMADDPAVQTAYWTAATERLATLLGFAVEFGASTVTAADILQSEFLRAVMLDQYVNVPATVQRTLSQLGSALNQPTTMSGWATATTGADALAALQQAQDALAQALQQSPPSVDQTGHLTTMTPAQASALESAVYWWRVHAIKMTKPDQRWKNIALGWHHQPTTLYRQHANPFGDLSHTPGELTP